VNLSVVSDINISILFDKGSLTKENATYVSNAKMYRLEDIMYHHV